ncbi:hypothetical protein EVAR_76434_1 [Eumeta japonica]|uniref:Uncharacterized protein n=1 Tax=Eumeta variegata TaxID=151549 RepID=A0A4C1TB23_EUMVA|nr:hypothetical protein EVAR_76434_1 [Eumeta japonica]
MSVSIQSVDYSPDLDPDLSCVFNLIAIRAPRGIHTPVPKTHALGLDFCPARNCQSWPVCESVGNMPYLFMVPGVAGSVLCDSSKLSVFEFTLTVGGCVQKFSF